MADGTPHYAEDLLRADMDSADIAVPALQGGNAPRRKPAWLLRREALTAILLIFGMVALLWGSIALDLQQQRKQLLRGAVRDSGNLARAAAESVGQLVAGVDNVLRLGRLVRDSAPDKFDLAAWASRVNAGRPVALELALVDQNGKLAASSLGPVQSAIDLSSADFFRYQAAHESDGLFIGRPAAGSGAKSWSVLFTRRLNTPDGLFAGSFVAAIDSSWLVELYQALDIGHGVLMLAGNDGAMRAYASGNEAAAVRAVGADISASTLMQAAAKQERGTVNWTNPLDGTPQLVGFQHLQGYPLIVAIGLDSREMLAPYATYVRQDMLFGTCLTVLILSVGLFLMINTRRLLLSRQLLQDAVDAISQGIVMVDRSGYVSLMNRRIRELLKLPAGGKGSRLRADQLPAFAAPVDNEGDPADPVDMPWHQSGDTGTPLEMTCADGTILEIQTHSMENGGYVRTYADVTERKRAELKISYLAYHDPLTGLANRLLFRERLASALGKTRHGGPGCAVLSLDLDGFKYANDRHGHMFGDAVLLEVTERLTGAVGRSGIVARFGGDEFFILLEALKQPELASKLADRLIALVSEPYSIGGRGLRISASIGIAQCPLDAQTVDDLLTHADTALYAAKAGGRGSFRSYETAMAVRISERRQIEQDLQMALSLDQMHVMYQPVFDCRTWRVSRFEALVRWTHPVHGDISPEIFIPVAEETGFIATLGHWVLRTACAQAAAWPADIAVAVNLSPKQFLEPDLVHSILAVLAKTGLAANRLTVEVTEGLLIDNVERASTALSALKAAGVRIALDDFGTGYSSLSYLHRFPISSIKIDKSFVTSLCKDDDADAIVRAILTLGQGLGLRVVAEGIENQTQLEWLLRAGCSEVQGFLLGRAIAPDAIGDCLAQAVAAAPLA